MFSKIIPLMFACLLFFSCDDTHIPEQKVKEVDHYSTLVIKNQSSVVLSNIIFDNTTFVNFQDHLRQGEEVRKYLTLNEDQESKRGYIYFSLLDLTRLVDKTIYEVRTNEVILLTKGKKIEFTITDSTLVVPIGTNNAFAISDLMTPAVLKITNETSIEFLNTTYIGVPFVSKFNTTFLFSTDSCKNNFYHFNPDGDYIYFEPYNKENTKSTERIRTEQRIKLEKEKEKSITIDVNTVIYVPSDGSKQTLGNFLKQMYGS